jgi:four helix bundle protein
LLRSGTSVGANSRAAESERSRPEFVAKLGDCLGDLSETDSWLELMAAKGIIPRYRLTPPTHATRELIAILTSITKKARNRYSPNFPCATPSPTKF